VQRCHALDKIKGSKVPMVLKIAPDLDTEQIDVIATLLLKFSIDGVIATNTLAQIGSMVRLMQMKQAVCLAHPYEASNLVISKLRSALGPRFPIIVWAELSVLTMPWKYQSRC
jgi:dihydroorotate dehydrogenase